jgi:hypothetical protein
LSNFQLRLTSIYRKSNKKDRNGFPNPIDAQ